MKTKIKYILLLSVVIIISVACNVNAATPYFTGRKSEHPRKQEYLNGITEEMCTSSYWKDKNFIEINKQLMTGAQINVLNRKIVDGSGTMVFDLEELQENFDADQRRESLASAQIPSRDLYIKGQKIDNQAYFSKIKQAILETGYTGQQQSKYGICTNRVNMKDWPIDDVIGYSATDTDDEMQSSAMNTNEPFLIRAKCEIDGQIFYWGYSTNCNGWVSGKNVAICETKQEWTDYWKVDTNANNFLTVIGSRIILENANLQPVSLMLGTVLKLVPKEEIPADLASQATTNYIVYFASKDEAGKAIKTYAVLNKSLELNQGYMKLTQNNILDVAFSCIGDEYGWGGMNGNMDCSLYTRSIYKCFGLELPRNTTWQQKVPEKYTDVSTMEIEDKKNYISTLPAGSLLYFNGHTMAYLGMDKDKNFVVSDLGTVVDEIGDVAVKSVYAVTVNSLDVRRGDGLTWLNHINGVISFLDPINLNECEVEIENEKLIYDGTEKNPKVTIKYEGKEIYEGANFNMKISNNVNVGTATIEISGINNFKGKITKNFEIEKDSEKQEGNKPEGEENPKEEDKPEGEKNPDDGEQSEDKKIEYQEEQPENKTPLEAMKDSLANLKLPFTGAGYISTPYFLIHILAILIVFAIYRAICRKENKK